jgi:hypothetical protein
VNFGAGDASGAHTVPPRVKMQQQALQLESKIAQFRLCLDYQFTQHLRIVKHLLTRTDIIFEQSSNREKLIRLIVKNGINQARLKKEIKLNFLSFWTINDMYEIRSSNLPKFA